MCLIISAPKGSMIPKELLVDATQRNPDGWGIMYHDGNRIVTLKSDQPNADAVFDEVKKIDRETIVHLRLTTHGGNTLENTHPFEIIPERLFMMHNGIVDVNGEAILEDGTKRSDTRIMVEDYLQPIVTKPGRIRNKGIKNFVQSLIGKSSNRLVFLDDQGKLTYFNKRLGIEWKGLWCSNTYAWTLHDEGRRTTFGRSYRSSYDYYDDYDFNVSPKGKVTAVPKAKATINTPEAYKEWWRTTPSKGIYDDEVDRLNKASGHYVSRGFDQVEYVEDDDTTCSLVLDSDRDEFKWATGNDQAADDTEDMMDELVGTEGGYDVPMWVAQALEMDYEELTTEDPEYLASVIVYLTDNVVGRPVE